MRRQQKNIYEIAEDAGVSIATVSRVLNHSAAVSPKTTQRVLDAIEKFNYVPNAAARNLNSTHSNCVGVVIPDINNPFFVQVLQGITSAADQLGLNIFLYGTDENSDREHKVLRSMREQRLRGIIIAPVSAWDSATREILEEYESFGTPVVLLDRELDNSSFDRVVTADEDGAYRAVSELIRCGHRKIAIITGFEFSRPGLERLNGYRKAMAEAGLPVPDEYLRKGNFRVNRACQATLELCELPDPPTAVFTANNLTTYGCLKALREKKLEIGEDISLFGFDEIEELTWLNFNLSVVSRDVPAMGTQAMHLLMRRFDLGHREDPGTRICLPTKIILRGSERYPSNRKTELTE